MSKRRLAGRLGVPGLVAVLGLLVASPVASAHVTISPAQGTAGSYTVLTVSVPHGCEGSPTTKVAIKIPKAIHSVTPSRNALWNVDKVISQLPEPITGPHGNKITERVSKVVYTAKQPLPPGYRDEFELSVKLPDTPGETLVFPTVQYCEQGKIAWVQVPSSGQGGEHLPHPAPTVKILPAQTESGSGGAAHMASASETHASGTQAESTQPGAWAIAGLVAGLLGLLAGAAALVRTRKST